MRSSASRSVSVCTVTLLCKLPLPRWQQRHVAHCGAQRKLERSKFTYLVMWCLSSFHPNAVSGRSLAKPQRSFPVRVPRYTPKRRRCMSSAAAFWASTCRRQCCTRRLRRRHGASASSTRRRRWVRPVVRLASGASASPMRRSHNKLQRCPACGRRWKRRCSICKLPPGELSWPLEWGASGFAWRSTAPLSWHACTAALWLHAPVQSRGQ